MHFAQGLCMSFFLKKNNTYLGVHLAVCLLKKSYAIKLLKKQER